MVLERAFCRVIGVLVFLLGVCVCTPSLLSAQDRSVPRFGPLIQSDTVEAGAWDGGRIWSFAEPPVEYLRETYGISADERGLRHARRGTVRLPNCSGALVSDEGLVLTAARCIRSLAGDVDADSFLAKQPDRERSLAEMYVDRVVEVNEVTARVDSLRRDEDEMGRHGAVAMIQESLQSAAPEGQRVEVSREGEGPRYVAYTYQRYEDVRLVFLPELQVTAFGAPESLLSYPQQAWDVAALRIYDDGRPLQSSEHFEIRSQGVRPGDAVFAVGFPSERQRGASLEQTAFWRDVTLPARLEDLEAWTSHLQTYADTADASGGWASRWRTAHAEAKQVRARREALGDSYFQARLRARDEQLRHTAEADTSRTSEITDLFDDLAAVQEQKRDIEDSFRAFSFLQVPDYASATVRRALLAYRAVENGIPGALDSLDTIPSQPESIDAARMGEHWEQIRRHLPADSALVRTLDQLGTPSSVVQQSVFSDPEAVRSMVQQGRLPTEDPLLDLVVLLHEHYDAFEREWASLLERERTLTDALHREYHRQQARPVAQPHARAPRFADGRVRSYRYNGTIAPPFTTFFGLYGQHASVQAEGDGALPSTWQPAPEVLDRTTPLTTIASTDMDGEYGGPLLNSSLELVGLRYDENVQSAAGRYLFLPARMRSVSVDVRGVLEGLSSIYGANELVREIQGRPASSQ